MRARSRSVLTTRRETNHVHIQRWCVRSARLGFCSCSILVESQGSQFPVLFPTQEIPTQERAQTTPLYVSNTAHVMLELVHG